MVWTRDRRREPSARRSRQTVVAALTAAIWMAGLPLCFGLAPQGDNPEPPKKTVKLVFVHHSCGENWLADAHGGLGRALARNHYFVSDTNYGWGPDGIGDRTDITDWPAWFTGRQRDNYLRALFRESGRHCDYTRTMADPGGENRIVLFKSCFPNSNLAGKPTDRPARGDGLTVGNAKAIYNELLAYFATRPDKLFVAITAPPLQDRSHAANARALNTWLVKDWLAGYRGKNVAVFDFYNVLTGPANHHRFHNGKTEHAFQPGRDTLHYPTGGDDHPSQAGNRRATEEFLPLLNVYYHRWIATAPQTAPTSPPPAEKPPAVTAPEHKPELPKPELPKPEPPKPDAPKAAGLVDDFEGAVDAWAAFRDEGKETRLTFTRDQEVKHGGAASLRIEYDLAPESWATCSRVHGQPRDWSNFQGLSLYVRVEKPGQPITVVVYGGKSGDDLQHFEVRFKAGQAAVGAWQRLDVRWQDLRLPAWQGDAQSRFDPRSAMGVALAFASSEGARNTGRLWIDDVTLLPPAKRERTEQ